MLTAREARRLDRNSEALGVPLQRLMDAAGRALAREAARMLGGRGVAASRGAVWVLCGKGNNGGDGLVAAAALQRQGFDAYVLLAEPGRDLHPLPARMLERVDRLRLAATRPPSAWPRPRLVLDCLLGTGASGPPRGPYAGMLRLLRRLQRSGAKVLACDVPSGLGSALAVRPDATVTFHGRKEGMDEAACGRIVVARIGIPREAADIGPGDLDAGYVRPRHDSHKGQNGVVAVVAGGPYRGAPYYAGMGAYRAGADLVHAFIPDDAARVVEGWGPEILVQAAEPGAMLTPIGAELVRPRLARAQALVLGPGLGTAAPTREACRILLEEAARLRIPTVVDADGLDALDADLMARHPAIALTPHAREFQDLAGRAASEANVRQFARRHAVLVVRKSHRTFVADQDRSRRSTRGHPTLTVGGTGDVLAGVLGTLLAKGAPRFDAACAATYLVARAGERLGSRLSYGATARDLLDEVPQVLLEMDGPAPPSPAVRVAQANA